MPLVKTLADRYLKYTRKMVPETTGARYGASKDIAVVRLIEGAGVMAGIRELARQIIETEGVPAGQQGIYFAFVQKLRKYAFSHSGSTLANIVQGVTAEFVAKGADPAILEKLSSLVMP
ncbi:MAG: hypothetical protein QW407_03310 [Thermofilaceae archaeon]